MSKLAVFYLSRYGNDLCFAQAFLKSLLRHRPGYDFDLIYILKGFPDHLTDPALTEYRSYIKHPVHEVRVSDEKFATNAFLDVATQADYGRILFLVSFSRIMAPDWLRSYLNAYDRVPDCGIAGATGGYEAAEGVPFPNVTVRTNAFMMDRKLLLSLELTPLATKSDGNRLEAGPNSLTRQVEARGLKPVVIDRFGKVWHPEDWPASLTFRSGQQEGLIIADNRTHQYAVANAQRRAYLSALNWGDKAVAPPAPVLRKLMSQLSWRWPLFDIYETGMI